MICPVPDMYARKGQCVRTFGLDTTGRIEYRFNLQGFRSNFDFDYIPQYAVFGCSLVFGIGVDVDSTVCNHLPNAFNFGLAGTYNNVDIYQTIVNFTKSNLYSDKTFLTVV